MVKNSLLTFQKYDLEHKNNPNSLTNFIDTEVDKRPSTKLDEF